jgi:enoyl-CoA hydratase/carnithine racemase
LNEIVRNPARVFASMFDKMNETYEAVGTQIRGDLGDSLKKAVQESADDIIRELGLEGTDEDKEAIKAANNMDMTKENVEIVKSVNAMINNLIKNMKPETVLNMIKDGVNPMNASIEEVNEYLTEANDKASKDNEEKFSKFLYKLDRKIPEIIEADDKVCKTHVLPDDEYIHQRCRSGSRCAD